MAELNECSLEACPECGSINLQNIDSIFEGEEYSQKVWCEDCGESWWEVYKFSYIDRGQ